MKKRRKANLSAVFVTTLIFVVISIMTSFLSSSSHKLTYNHDNETIVIAKVCYDPWSGHRDGDTTYEIKEVKKDKKEIKIYF